MVKLCLVFMKIMPNNLIVLKTEFLSNFFFRWNMTWSCSWQVLWYSPPMYNSVYKPHILHKAMQVTVCCSFHICAAYICTHHKISGEERHCICSDLNNLSRLECLLTASGSLGRAQECLAVLLCVISVSWQPAAGTLRTRKALLTPAFPQITTPTSSRRPLCLRREDFLCNHWHCREEGPVFAFPPGHVTHSPSSNHSNQHWSSLYLAVMRRGGREKEKERRESPK